MTSCYGITNGLKFCRVPQVAATFGGKSPSTHIICDFGRPYHCLRRHRWGFAIFDLGLARFSTAGTHFLGHCFFQSFSSNAHDRHLRLAWDQRETCSASRFRAAHKIFTNNVVKTVSRHTSARPIFDASPKVARWYLSMTE